MEVTYKRRCGLDIHRRVSVARAFALGPRGMSIGGLECVDSRCVGSVFSPFVLVTLHYSSTSTSSKAGWPPFFVAQTLSPARQAGDKVIAAGHPSQHVTW